MSANQGIADKPAVDDLERRRSPDGDTWALGDEPYRASDEEIAAMSESGRRAFLAQRAKNEAAWAKRDAVYALEMSALNAGVKRDNRNASTPGLERGRRTKFIGGSLDGQEHRTLGATYYIHDLGGDHFEEYKRTRTTYVDGADYANEVNQERLSHLEYTFQRTAGREIL